MKMTNTFIMPIKREEGGVMPFVKDNQGALIAVVESRHADAIINAVNCHDEMYKALESLANGEGLPPGVTIERLLAKARGEK